MNQPSFAFRNARIYGGLLLTLASSACSESHDVDFDEHDATYDAVYDDDEPDARVQTTRSDSGVNFTDLFGDLLDNFGGNRRDGGVRDAGPRDAGPADASVDAGPRDAGPADAGGVSGLCRNYPQLPFCPRDAGASDAGREAGAAEAGVREAGALEAGSAEAGADGAAASP